MNRRFSMTVNRFLWQAAVLTTLLGTAASSGCGERMSDSLRQPGSQSLQSAGAVTVTDRLGRSVRFSEPPQRIVSLSPSLTEILFAIGAGDRVVGATQYCDYPSAALDIPRIGGGTLESINQELIVGLEPDLVLCKADTHEPLLKNLERLGIPLLGLGPETVAELYDHTKLLGQVTGNSTQADRLVYSMQQRIAAVTARIPPGDGPLVFYQVWDDPLMTVGKGSYISELLSLAGSRSLFDETDIRYPKVSTEAVIAGNPDVIIAPAMHATPVTVEDFLSRPGWSQLRAVQDNRIYVIDRDRISRCGPRLVDALEEIVAALYPHQFPPRPADADPSGMVQSKDRAP